MLKAGMNKAEIEKELYGKGDYVQIHDLRRFVQENIPVDVKRAACVKLVEIYERRSMFLEASFIYDKLAEMAVSSAEKVSFLIKEVECSVKAGSLEKADAVMLKIMTFAKPMERGGIIRSVREFYKRQAQAYEKERRKSKAVEIYEKIITLKDVSEEEKEEINRKLVVLYKDLGMVGKYLGLKEKIK
ncbi:MAG: hypothetical protein KGH55_03275 [Nanoarchaeota archaeon]|nr:hypothetical protein [Nanoarchaeota archaeon]